MTTTHLEGIDEGRQGHVPSKVLLLPQNPLFHFS